MKIKRLADKLVVWIVTAKSTFLSLLTAPWHTRHEPTKKGWQNRRSTITSSSIQKTPLAPLWISQLCNHRHVRQWGFAVGERKGKDGCSFHCLPTVGWTCWKSDVNGHITAHSKYKTSARMKPGFSFKHTRQQTLLQEVKITTIKQTTNNTPKQVRHAWK